LIAFLALDLAWVAAAAAGAHSADTPAVVGLDHVTVAVRDLEKASDAYRRLGFALKPGRLHENGIRNQHVKFRDGTELELIAATDTRDPTTAQYLKHLSAGDGPAFAGLYAPDINALARTLDAARQVYDREGGMVSLPGSEGSRYLFFFGRNHSPTDTPAHFAHVNGAEALIGVWIAADDLPLPRNLLVSLGADLSEEPVRVPDPATATVARFREGQMTFLPASRQLIRGRPVVGAVLQTRDLDAVRRALAAAHLRIPDSVQTTHWRSLFIPPAVTHGIWLEFREPR
jgi:catechol 2,3-dioxygenase-like lactoylglutathione lyase family enzyme